MSNFPRVIVLDQRQISGFAVSVIIADTVRESNSNCARVSGPLANADHRVKVRRSELQLTDRRTHMTGHGAAPAANFPSGFLGHSGNGSRNYCSETIGPEIIALERRAGERRRPPPSRRAAEPLSFGACRNAAAPAAAALVLAVSEGSVFFLLTSSVPRSVV